MSERTSIEWCDSTFNPWIGCTKISPACDHCYAEALMDTRHGRVKWGGERSRTSLVNWQLPHRWQRAASKFKAEYGRRRRVFCSSLADVFDNQVPHDWRVDLWALIRDTPDLDWLLLTKRPQNIGKMLPVFWDEVKGHVWLGTTVEDQTRADQNIPHLLQHDAAVRFVSCEPLLGPIDLGTAWHGEGALDVECWGDCGWCSKGYPPLHNCQRGLGHWERGRSGLDWVIAGGESGAKARPSHPDWFRSLRDQCAKGGVPFLLKQWGEWAPGESANRVQTSTERVATFYDEDWTNPGWHFGAVSVRASEEMHLDDEPDLWRMGKRRAGRHLDGIIHNSFPVPA
jgi:protein gp37